MLYNNSKGGEYMNQNYLLHNETAKKLYFQYAKDLPIIAFCNQSDDVYTNITEAFLSNDTYKLESMRQGGIDEKYITGNVSDYEKFKAFCTILPKFAGNPIYLLSHIELFYNFDCELSICEDNCDILWSKCNEYLNNNTLENNIVMTQCIDFDDITEFFYLDKNLKTYNEFENSIVDKIVKANENGCKNAILSLYGELEKPNPYAVNEIYRELQVNYDNITHKEFRMLDIQLLRNIGKVCKKLSWNYLYRLYEPSEELLNYLDENPLLDSYVVSVKDVRKMSSIAEQIMLYQREISFINTILVRKQMILQLNFQIMQKMFA